MAIEIANTRQILANAYKVAGAAHNSVPGGNPYVGLHTGPPGPSGTANQVTGGSPAYARKQMVWTSGSGGVLTGSSVTIDVPAGTYTHASLWTGPTGDGAAVCIDWVKITDTTLGAQGQIVVTPSFTQV